VGRILGAHGIRGDVLVRRFGEAAEVLDRGRALRLERAGHEMTLVVASSRPHKGVWLVTFEGVPDRNAAQALAGSVLTVDESELPPLEEGVYYHFELVGLEVVTDSGIVLGKVTGILETGANDILEVRGPKGEVLLPMIEPVLKEVDRDAGRIVVHLLPGLIEEEG